MAHWAECPIHNALRLTYSDGDITYPLVVILHLRQEGGDRVGTWLIDHEKSAALWQIETGTDREFPAYGLWLRVDEAAVDALLCWRELEVLASKMNVDVRGGWLNGAWHYRIRRRFSADIDDTLMPDPVVRPVLLPFDAAAPDWQFVEAPRLDERVELKHIRRDPGKLPYLPANKPLEGFQASTPHLIERQTGAVMFPAYPVFRWWNGGVPPSEYEDELSISFAMTYANDQCFFTVADRLLDFGLRCATSAEEFADCPTPADARNKVLASPKFYTLWRQLSLTWPGSSMSWAATNQRIPVSRETFESEMTRRRESMRRYSHLKTRFRDWNHDSVELPYASACGDCEISGLYVAGVYRPEASMHLSSDPVLSVKERAQQRMLSDPKRSGTLRPAPR
jgi:hypothetical protein